jgi:hypothetical protein
VAHVIVSDATELTKEATQEKPMTRNQRGSEKKKIGEQMWRNVSYVVFLEQGLLFGLASNLLRSPRWPGTCNPLSSASGVLRLQAHATMPSLKSVFIFK